MDSDSCDAEIAVSFERMSICEKEDAEMKWCSPVGTVGIDGMDADAATSAVVVTASLDRTRHPNTRIPSEAPTSPRNGVNPTPKGTTAFGFGTDDSRLYPAMAHPDEPWIDIEASTCGKVWSFDDEALDKEFDDLDDYSFKRDEIEEQTRETMGEVTTESLRKRLNRLRTECKCVNEAVEVSVVGPGESSLSTVNSKVSVVFDDAVEAYPPVEPDKPQECRSEMHEWPISATMDKVAEKRELKAGQSGYVRQQTGFLEQSNFNGTKGLTENVSTPKDIYDTASESSKQTELSYAEALMSRSSKAPQRQLGYDALGSDVDKLKVALIGGKPKTQVATRGWDESQYCGRSTLAKLSSAASGEKRKTAAVQLSWEHDANPGSGDLCQLRSTTKKQRGLTPQETKRSMKKPPAVKATDSLLSREKMIDVCIVVDCSPAMTKFMIPLRSSLVYFWKMLHSSNEYKVRIGCATTMGLLELTEEESDFVAFIESLKTDQHLDGDTKGHGGFAKAMSFLHKMKTKTHAQKHVFLLTNLACLIESDDDKGSVGTREAQETLCSLISGIPQYVSVALGTWLNGNDLLMDVLKKRRWESTVKNFPLLSAIKMAHLVVKDVDLLQGVRESLSSCFATRSPSRVRMFEGEIPSKKPGMHPRRTKKVRVKASLLKLSEIKTIQEIQSASVQPIKRSCQMERDDTPFEVTATSDIYCAKFGGAGKRKWTREHLILKGCKIDTLRGGSDFTSRTTCLSRLWSSTVARFLAKVYNKDHKPQHCRRIQFCSSWMIEEDEGDCSKGRTFYVEEMLQPWKKKERYQVFCRSSGEWNETCADESLLRFVQTTFKISGGDLIVAGLKGIRFDDVFLLTDPVVLTRNAGTSAQKECTKEYMKRCRLEAKEIMERRGWNKRMPVEEESRKGRFFNFL